jgi:hypothetical protein
MVQIVQFFKIKKLIFILIASIFILSFASAITLDSTTVLNTTVSNSSMTFSIEVTASEITIEPTYIYLTSVSYVQDGTTKTCSTLNHSTANTVLDSANFPCTESTSDPPGGGGGVSPRNYTKLVKEGYEKYFLEGEAIEFILNNEEYTLKLENISENQTFISIRGESYSLNISETQKIDLNDDGYYNFQIVLKSTSSNMALLEFKEIYEEIPAEKQEEKKEPSKTEEEGEEKREWWIWLVLGGLGMLIALQIIFYLKKLKKRKRFIY